MQFIPTRVHGVLDYGTALILIVVPFFFLNPVTATACWVLIGAGIALLALSLLTRYELGLFKAIPMSTHLVLDALLGIFLIASPWIFGFAELIWWPHVLVGVAELGAAFTTRPYAPLEHVEDGTYTAEPIRR